VRTKKSSSGSRTPSRTRLSKLLETASRMSGQSKLEIEEVLLTLRVQMGAVRNGRVLQTKIDRALALLKESPTVIEWRRAIEKEGL
jgi:hypothetical protein